MSDQILTDEFKVGMEPDYYSYRDALWAQIQELDTDALRSEALSYLKGKPRQRWKRVLDHPRGFIYDVEINADGTITGSAAGNYYSERKLLEALVVANRRLAKRRSDAAKKAGETRRVRRERKVYQVVEKLKEGGKLPSGDNCFICQKSLTDDESRERGIGPDCWQDIMHILESRPG